MNLGRFAQDARGINIYVDIWRDPSTNKWYWEGQGKKAGPFPDSSAAENNLRDRGYYPRYTTRP